MKEHLTLIVPLLDRANLTRRVLNNLYEQNCPFKIIVADGSQHPFSFAYKELDIDYFYNGYDAKISNYMNKMHNAMQRVETPLCMVFDNDDLIDLAGVINGVSFMSKNKEYSTYQNDVRPLYVKEKVEIDKEPLYKVNSIEQDDPLERLEDVISNFNSFNYAIFRTPICKCYFEILDTLQNDDFQLFQKCWAYASSVFGKCKRLQDESYYYFIPGNSIIQGTGKVHKFSSWVETKYWKNSCPMIISIVSSMYEKLYNKDIRKDFCKAFIKEVCEKNNVEGRHDGYESHVISESFKYDDKINSVINKYSFDYADFDFSSNFDATHEGFIEWLNT